MEVSNDNGSHFGMIRYHILEAPVRDLTLKPKASWDVGGRVLVSSA